MDELAFALFETAAAWEEQGALVRFRRALRRADQRVLEDLLAPAYALAGADVLYALNIEEVLLVALLSEQREIQRLLEALHATGAPQLEDD